MIEHYLKNISTNFSILWLLFGVLMAILLSVVSIPCIIKIANQKKLMANPSNRSSHISPVPTLGGVSIFISVSLIAILYSVINNNTELLTLILSLIILFFLGVNDDLMVISPKSKFIGQLIVASLIIMASNFRVETLNGLLGIYELSHINSFLVTLFFYILIMNAYNLIDGIDGLAGTVGIFASAFFVPFFYFNIKIHLAVISISLLGALLVFTKYNLSKKNKIFMGDTGSMIVGFLLAFLSIAFLKTNYSLDSLEKYNNPEIIICALLFYPLLDTTRIFFNRQFIYKTSPFMADKNHIHHKLLLLNPKHIEVTKFICHNNLMVLSIAIYTTDLNIHISLLLTWIIGIITLCIPFLKRRLNENKEKTLLI